MKVEMNPSAQFFPCPVVLVTCVDGEGKPNIITLAWVGIACAAHPTIGMEIRPQTYSYELIRQTREFVVNVPTASLLRETIHCGTVSGRDHDKFAEVKLTPEPARQVKPPLIVECPINLECVLREVVKLGVHDLFLGQVVRVHADQAVLDERDRVDFQEAQPLVYNPSCLTIETPYPLNLVKRI